MMRKHSLILLLALLWSTSAGANEFVLAHQIVGNASQYVVQERDSFASIGSRFGVAASLIAVANGSAINRRPLPGSAIWMDNRHIVPADIIDGILVNIPQRMLFFFKDGSLVAAYPVAVGRPSHPTPRGDFAVAEMRRDPVWVVPASIQREMAQRGKEVETRVPPGPDNPLGRYWIGLDRGEIGIHGTIAPGAIYHFRTHGCIRMHPDDAAEMFPFITVGMTVRIVYEPELLARLDDGRFFVEINPDSYRKTPDSLAELHAIADSNHVSDMIDWQRVNEVLREEQGVARDVTFRNLDDRNAPPRDSAGEQQAFNRFSTSALNPTLP